MVKIVAVCFLLSIIGGIHTAHIGTRIIGGHDAKPHQFPYQAIILLNFDDDLPVYCGGSVISEEYILTAAHCLDGIEMVSVSMQFLNNKLDTKTIFIVAKQDFIIHPDWDMDSRRSDIALIKLTQPVTFKKGEIEPVSLPNRSHNDNFDDILLTASGWNFKPESFSECDDTVLQYAELPILPIERCQGVFTGDIGEKNICIDASNGISIQFGDYGGPLVMREEDGYRTTLVGVISYSDDHCEDGCPLVATKVSSYLDWISKETGIQILD